MAQGRQLKRKPPARLAARPPIRLEPRPGALTVRQLPARADHRPAELRPRQGQVKARPKARKPLRRFPGSSHKPKVKAGPRRAGSEHHGPAAGFPVAQDAAALTSQQAQNIITCLAQCQRHGADELATLALMCLGYGENSWHTYGCNSSDHCGVFQLDSSWQRMHAYTDVAYWAAYALLHGFYQGGLIPNSRKYPHQSPGYLTNLCQGAYADLAQGARYYDQFEADARWAIRTYARRAGLTLKAGGSGSGSGGGGGGIPGGGAPLVNVQAVFKSSDWAGNVINCWKFLRGGANEASHMAGLTRQHVGKLKTIGWKVK